MAQAKGVGFQGTSSQTSTNATSATRSAGPELHL